MKLIHGDALEVLKTLESASVDAIVTDPPAGISWMGEKWDCKGNRSAFIAFLAPIMAEALRVARPGAVALVWAIPRTSHWTATALEDAGWGIEDRISHLFGTGFPKHKSKLKPACEDWWLCRKPGPKWLGVEECRIAGALLPSDGRKTKGKGAIGSARVYDGGWDEEGYAGPEEAHPESARHDARGRWPANLVLSHVDGPDGCRPVGTKRVKGSNQPGKANGEIASGIGYGVGTEGKPRRVTFHTDPSAYGMEEVEAWECVEGCPVKALDGQTQSLCKAGNLGGTAKSMSGYSGAWPQGNGMQPSYGDKGGASRFFYCAKASKADRGKSNNHTTVKNTALMAWLVALACPEGGTVLDPFSGSASTGVACIRTGRNFIGIEQDAAYVEIARKRLAEAQGPLFAGATP